MLGKTIWKGATFLERGSIFLFVLCIVHKRHNGVLLHLQNSISKLELLYSSLQSSLGWQFKDWAKFWRMIWKVVLFIWLQIRKYLSWRLSWPLNSEEVLDFHFSLLIRYQNLIHSYWYWYLSNFTWNTIKFHNHFYANIQCVV